MSGEPRRVAVVAGASSGIGAATARRLAQTFHVVVAARRFEACQGLAAELNAAGLRATPCVLDVTVAESVTECVRLAQAQGEVAVVVANAALNRPARVLEAEPAFLIKHFETNVLGAQRLINGFGPELVRQQRGDLVFISSDVVWSHRPGTGPYNASKCALEGLVRTLQWELEGTGVRASLVRPGPTWTEMGMDWDPEVTTRALADWARIGLARHGGFLQPEAVADAVGYLAELTPGVTVPVLDVQPLAPVTR